MMTDKQTTELLPCPFCGDKASWIKARQREDGKYYSAACGCRKCGIWRYGDSFYGHDGFATDEDFKTSMEQAVSKWNTRITQGALTVEQVEKAIHDCSIYASYDGVQYYASGIRLQAITDMLNVFGNGYCEMAVLERYDGGDPHYRCSACGHENNEDYLPNHCPNCGMKVKPTTSEI